MQDPPGQSYGAGSHGTPAGPPAGGFGGADCGLEYGPTGAAPSRAPYVLAGISAFMAAGYWGFLALLTGLSVFAGASSGALSIMPVLLVVLYVVRGLRVLKGDLRSTKSLLWLHGLGMVFAGIAIFGGESLLVAGLHAIKIAIHVFGLIVTYRAKKYAETSTFSSGQIPMM